jgi:hypothetical protein
MSKDNKPIEVNGALPKGGKALMGQENAFGGKNAGSNYVPMSEDEQEVLSRLIEMEDLEVHVINWGILNQPKFTLGDKRLAVKFTLNFNAPALPMPVHYFDLELRTRSGLVLYSERQPTLYGGLPISVQAGTELQMVWDIAIDRIPPSIVKMFKPDAHGLTSRWTDKDTGDINYLTGNMNLDAVQRKLLEKLQKGKAVVKKMNAAELAKATKMSGRR